MIRTDLYHQEATYKQHTNYSNATIKQREDKRIRDRLYEAVNEWTR